MKSHDIEVLILQFIHDIDKKYGPCNMPIRRVELDDHVWGRLAYEVSGKITKSGTFPIAFGMDYPRRSIQIFGIEFVPYEARP